MKSLKNMGCMPASHFQPFFINQSLFHEKFLYNVEKDDREMLIKVSVWFSSTLTGSHLCVFVPLKTVSDDQNDKADDNQSDDSFASE